MPGKILALAADNVITFSFVAQQPLPVAAPVMGQSIDFSYIGSQLQIIN